LRHPKEPDRHHSRARADVEDILIRADAGKFHELSRTGVVKMAVGVKDAPIDRGLCMKVASLTIERLRCSARGEARIRSARCTLATPPFPAPTSRIT
jgi:hypothetical protein